MQLKHEWGPGRNLRGGGELNSSPPWKLYFNHWVFTFNCHEFLDTRSACVSWFLL